jgi:hypothetical protein
LAGRVHLPYDTPFSEKLAPDAAFDFIPDVFFEYQYHGYLLLKRSTCFVRILFVPGEKRPCGSFPATGPERITPGGLRFHPGFVICSASQHAHHRMDASKEKKAPKKANISGM